MLRKSHASALLFEPCSLVQSAITGTWTLPFTTYLMLLSGRVSQQRRKERKALGVPTSTAAGGEDADSLLVANRCHLNFLENVPLALFLAAVVELNGGNRKVLNGALAVLLACRIAHVEFGLRGPGATANARLIGHAGTQGFLAGMAGYAAYLVKGYWGFWDESIAADS